MNANQPQVQLIPAWECADLRQGGRNAQGNKFEPAVASGRAACRRCGQKIAKGEQCLQGDYDFTGCGSWTSVHVYLHLNCQANQ